MKVVTLEHLLQNKPQGKIAFTNGCFDLLHIGHIRTLQEAKAQADVLVVGVNSDRSVRALNKGPTRPLTPQEERAEILAALECVDYVVIFDEDTPIPLLQRLKPDVHVKGGDYKVEDLPETPVVQAYGGRVHVTGMIPGRSTTLLEARLADRRS